MRRPLQGLLSEHPSQGLEPILAQHADCLPVVELTPLGQPRRDWRKSVVGDGWGRSPSAAADGPRFPQIGSEARDFEHRRRAALETQTFARERFARGSQLLSCRFDLFERGRAERDEVRILFQASDGSERGKSKLHAPGGRGSFFEVLTASELGLSFGRERVIHAALGFGGLTERIREDAIRLSGVRELGGDKVTGKVK